MIEGAFRGHGAGLAVEDEVVQLWVVEADVLNTIPVEAGPAADVDVQQAKLGQVRWQIDGLEALEKEFRASQRRVAVERGKRLILALAREGEGKVEQARRLRDDLDGRRVHPHLFTHVMSRGHVLYKACQVLLLRKCRDPTTRHALRWWLVACVGGNGWWRAHEGGTIGRCPLLSGGTGPGSCLSSTT